VVAARAVLYLHTVCAECVASAAFDKRAANPGFAVWYASAEAGRRGHSSREQHSCEVLFDPASSHCNQHPQQRLLPKWREQRARTAILTGCSAGITTCNGWHMLMDCTGASSRTVRAPMAT
jgi:hypothetical protein